MTRLIHCVDLYATGSDHEDNRLKRAQETWERAGLLGANRIGTNWKVRDSTEVGSSRKLPFIRDILDAGTRMAGHTEAILVLTNADSALVVETGEKIEEAVVGGVVVVGGVGGGEGGPVWSRRKDWTRPIRGYLSLEMNERLGVWSPGIDLVAMSAKWWQEVGRGKIPDLLMGVEGWDWVMRYEGVGMADTVVAHEMHGEAGGVWFGHAGRGRKEVANRWNRMLCLEWWRGLESERQVEVGRGWAALKEYEAEYKENVKLFEGIRNS